MLALPYHPDPLPLLAALRPLGRAVLLHSADHLHPFAGTDILTAAPSVAIETRGADTCVHRAGRVQHSPREPFELLDELLAHLPTDQSTALPTGVPTLAPSQSTAPFRGGVIGIAGYDLARRQMALGHRLPDAGEFPDLAAGLYTWTLVTDHARRSTRIHTLPGHPLPSEVTAALSSIGPVAAIELPTLRPEMDADAYAAAFARVQEYISAGDCYQVNLAVPFSAPCNADPLALYAALVNAQPAPYAGFLETPSGAVLSCSPERLLHCAAGRVTTSPIKGTRGRHEDAELDARARRELLASAKDRAENLMIVDLLRNDLGRSCTPGSIAVPRLFEVQSFPAVHHLVSTIEGCLAPGTTPLQAMARAFPGGSITGAPKLRAMQIIEELEVRRRGPYCGSLFRAGPDGSLDASITIRTLLLAQGRLTCWGGGGLVADSVVDAEWREIHDKIGTLISPDSKAGR